MKRLKSELDSDEYAKLEGMMWILRKQHECLSDADKSKLELLYKHSDKLKKAHSYALKLSNIFNMQEKYKSYIVNYFKKRKNSGFVEGMNNKIKVAKRRCYGFSAVKTIFQSLFLDFQGLEIYA